VAGGFDLNGHVLATAELFDPTAGSFAPTGSMTTPRLWHTATLPNDGKVLVMGGVDSIGSAPATAQLYQ